MKKLAVSSFYEYWEELLKRYSDRVALQDNYLGGNYTFREAFSAIKQFACGLRSLGLQKDDHISIFSENSSRWMVVDQAILVSGMVDAVRGSGSSTQELEYILEQSDSVALVVENLTVLKKVLNKANSLNLKFIIHLSKEKFEGENPIPVYSFDEVLKMGDGQVFEPVAVDKDSLATLIYTSGTTGVPKGVMLTVNNLLSQVENIFHSIPLKKSGLALCILPIWHAYERTLEYYLLSGGVTMFYTNLKNFKQDMKKYLPTYFVSVPRIWESIFDGIQKKVHSLPQEKQDFIKKCIENSIKFKNSQRCIFNADKKNFHPTFGQKLAAIGDMILSYPMHVLADMFVFPDFRKGVSPNFAMGISGGGALQWHLDEFFDALGIPVLNGYGLTETAPVLGVRNPRNLVLGSIGQPIAETQIRVIDSESQKEVAEGAKGVLCVKGPQIMRGYYKNPEATQAVLASDGWFNTGDLVVVSPNGSVFITGRAKDTIVLSNGENIEPQGIEEACAKSPYIRQIIVVGQDKPSLGALVVPDYENIKTHIGDDVDVPLLLRKEVQKLVQERENFVPFERISAVRVVEEEFTVDNGLMTPTGKIRRNKVFDQYANLIDDMFS